MENRTWRSKGGPSADWKRVGVCRQQLQQRPSKLVPGGVHRRGPVVYGGGRRPPTTTREETAATFRRGLVGAWLLSATSERPSHWERDGVREWRRRGGRSGGVGRSSGHGEKRMGRGRDGRDTAVAAAWGDGAAAPIIQLFERIWFKSVKSFSAS